MDDPKDAPLQSDQNKEAEDPSDKLTPEHPRFKQVIEKLHNAETENADLKTRLDNLESVVSERQVRTGEEGFTEEEQVALIKIENELLKRGFAKKEDVEQTTRVNQRAQTLEKLTAKYGGDSEYPKFDNADVVEHAKKNGFGENYEAAYFDLHRQGIIEIEARKLANMPETIQSEKPTGGARHAPQGELTVEQIQNMSDEEYEQKRGQILAGIKTGLKSS